MRSSELKTTVLGEPEASSALLSARRSFNVLFEQRSLGCLNDVGRL